MLHAAGCGHHRQVLDTYWLRACSCVQGLCSTMRLTDDLACGRASHLRRLELRGTGSDRVIAAALDIDSSAADPAAVGGACAAPDALWRLLRRTGQTHTSQSNSVNACLSSGDERSSLPLVSGGATGMQLPHRAVLPLWLRDPRLARPVAAAPPLASLEESQAQPPAAAQRPESDYSPCPCSISVN